jgi:two-component system phosphate regulon response regulator PhoB
MRLGRILIVDDDQDTRVLLGEDLTAWGHEALYAHDAIQALMTARRERPDLILLDFRLPGGSGVDVLQRLKLTSETSSIPVVVFSGQHSPEVVAEVLRLGARAYVQKSFVNVDLGSVIQQVLEPATAIVEPPVSVAV